MRQDYWSLGTWGRIPVSMHWTVLLSFAWLYIIFFDVVAMLFGAIALFALFVAHEYGHVFVLRRRRIAVTGIALFGIHGETSYNEYAAKGNDATAAAWGGVAAQGVVLLLALAAGAFIPFAQVPFGQTVWAPMHLVLTKINIFLMIIALLPIGPFDGHAAWKVFKRRRPAKPVAKKKVGVAPPPAPEPEAALSEEQMQEMDKSSEKMAADLMAKLTGKSGASADDSKG
jgi:Zn-dependent protease